jgi:hypothetical protein
MVFSMKQQCCIIVVALVSEWKLSTRVMNGIKMPPLLNPQHLDLQGRLFKVTMNNNAKVELKETCDIKLAIKL